VHRSKYSIDVFDNLAGSHESNYRLDEFEEKIKGLAEQLEKIQEALANQHYLDYRQYPREDRVKSDIAAKNGMKTKNKHITESGSKIADITAEGEIKRGFTITTDYRKGDKEYRVDVSLPKGFGLDDMRVSLYNSILTIKTRRENRDKTRNTRYYSFNSFFQSFSIPETTATTGDIRRELVDGTLKLYIPIISPNSREK
jgi:HSP20 family molecular chaperone IbpA